MNSKPRLLIKTWPYQGRTPASPLFQWHFTMKWTQMILAIVGQLKELFPSICFFDYQSFIRILINPTKFFIRSLYHKKPENSIHLAGKEPSTSPHVCFNWLKNRKPWTICSLHTEFDIKSWSFSLYKKLGCIIFGNMLNITNSKWRIGVFGMA